MISLLCSLAAVARADDYDKAFSVDGFVATTTVPDPAWRLFSENDAMPAWGARLGWRPVERVAVTASWAAVRRGAEVSTGGWTDASYSSSYSDTDDGAWTPPSVAAATGHQLALGAKADLSLGDVVLPSVGANGVLLPMTWRFDGDPDRDDAAQVRAAGLLPGLELLGGLEVRVPPHEIAAVAAWIELGGAVYGRGTFGDLGTLRPGGFVARGGVGLRF